MMYHRIVVPIEEGRGEEGVRHACPLARALGAEVMLLHVHHAQQAPPELEGLTQYRYQHVVEAWDDRDAEAEVHEVEWLSARADALAAREPGLTIISRVVHAPLRGALDAGESRVLVVTPAVDEDGGLDRTARALIQGGGVPILLVRPGADTPLDGRPLRHVLIALDGSAFSEEVLGPALDLARAAGARVSLMEVVTRHTGLARWLRPGERSAEAAETSLRQVRDRLPASVGPVAVKVVEHESPAQAIVAEARRDGVDLIAMATHGRGGLLRLMLGSVAERVVSEAPLPVLLFRPTGARTEANRMESAATAT